MQNQESADPWDLIVVGAGIIGLTVAYEYLLEYPGRCVLIVEKEAKEGLHASGRNSGVLHAGFYYSSDSLKARFCSDGNLRMKAFCRQEQVPINPCQKVVVARNLQEVDVLHELYEQGQRNDVPLALISAEELAEFEPNAKTYQWALLSPSTATVDPGLVCSKLVDTLKRLGCKFLFNFRLESILDQSVVAKLRSLNFKTLVNAAGLYADHLARGRGKANDLRILPFRGHYLKYLGPSDEIQTNIYPIPHKGNSFLGVHFTKTAQGDVKIGPTATPAFWREHYQGFKNFRLGEVLPILSTQSQLLLGNHSDFRSLAFGEIKKTFGNAIFTEAKRLVHHLSGTFQELPPGIRAQLVNVRSKKLITDFLIQEDGNILHILNAVSPAFTCSFAFARHVVGYLTKLDPEPKSV
jgi:(S)-2-hydroxyglutarate dehydrogenase